MHRISHDSPCYYLTSVAKDRLSVFRSDEIKLITCAALNEARQSGKLSVYAYVIMPDHVHVEQVHLCPLPKLCNSLTALRAVE